MLGGAADKPETGLYLTCSNKKVGTQKAIVNTNQACKNWLPWAD